MKQTRQLLQPYMYSFSLFLSRFELRTKQGISRCGFYTVEAEQTTETKIKCCILHEVFQLLMNDITIRIITCMCEHLSCLLAGV